MGIGILIMVSPVGSVQVGQRTKNCSSGYQVSTGLEGGLAQGDRHSSDQS